MRIIEIAKKKVIVTGLQKDDIYCTMHQSNLYLLSNAILPCGLYVQIS
jgi:hypothetical protein